MRGIPFNIASNDVWGYVFHGFNQLTFNATNQQYNLILKAYEDATITHVGFNFHSMTGSPGDLSFRLTDVGTTGNPGSTTHASATIASSVPTYASGGSLYWGALSASYNVTRGQIVCCTLITTTGTWNSTNFIQLNYQLNDNKEAHGNRTQFPYASRGSSRQIGFIGGMRSSTTAYGYPISNLGIDTYSFTSTRYGTRFTVPSMGASVKLAGVRLRALCNGGSSYSIVIGTISGSTVTETYTESIDTDLQASSAEGYTHEHYFVTPPTLTCGQEYVIGILAGADNVQFGSVKLTAVIDRSAFVSPLYGDAKSGSWTSGGTWTTDDTRLYLIHPFIDTITASSSAGGLIVHPGMTGGIHG